LRDVRTTSIGAHILLIFAFDVKNFSRLIPWIDRLPFATVTRILHLSLPETCDWAFRPAAQSHIELDPELFSYYTWSPRTVPSDYSIAKAVERKRMLVAIQPPWILTLRDLEQFAESRCVGVSLSFHLHFRC
jgi:hypothetical protein